MVPHLDILAKLHSAVAQYQPGAQYVQALRQAHVTIFAGITGAGKNTVITELMKTSEYHDLVTSTTRPPRINNGILERDTVDYYFLSKDQALEKLYNQEYLEASIVHENVYGLLGEEILKSNQSGKKAVIDVDVSGVDIYKSLSDTVLAIFIIPPSYEVWHQRTVARYQTNQEYETDWPIRRASAIKELQLALSKPYYHFVINDTLSDTVAGVKKVMAHRDTFHPKDREMRAIAEELLRRFEASE